MCHVVAEGYTVYAVLCAARALQIGQHRRANSSHFDHLLHSPDSHCSLAKGLFHWTALSEYHPACVPSVPFCKREDTIDNWRYNFTVIVLPSKALIWGSMLASTVAVTIYGPPHASITETYGICFRLSSLPTSRPSTRWRMIWSKLGNTISGWILYDALFCQIKFKPEEIVNMNNLTYIVSLRIVLGLKLKRLRAYSCCQLRRGNRDLWRLRAARTVSAVLRFVALFLTMFAWEIFGQSNFRKYQRTQ